LRAFTPRREFEAFNSSYSAGRCAEAWPVSDGTGGVKLASFPNAPFASRLFERFARLMGGVWAFGGKAAPAMLAWV
jgi:hypothetical protein